MKMLRFFFCVAMGMAFSTDWVLAVKIGDKERDVRKELGKPNGVLELDDSTKILSYDRGDVTLKDGVVVKTELLGEGKTWSQISKNAAEADSKRREANQEANNRPLQELLESKSFQKMKTKDKIAKLQEFAKLYPRANVQAEIEKLEDELQAEKDAKLGKFRPDKEKEEAKKADEGKKPEESKSTGSSTNAPSATPGSTTNNPAAPTK